MKDVKNVDALTKSILLSCYEYDKEIVSIFANGIKDIIKIKALFGKFITVASANEIIDNLLLHIKRHIDEKMTEKKQL